MASSSNSNSGRRVQAGAPLRIHASTWNTLQDLAGTAAGQPGAGRAQGSPSPGIVHVNNESGLNLERYHVVGLVGVPISYADNGVEFLAGTPLVSGDFPDDGDPFAILQDCVPDGMIAPAMVVGATQVLLHVINENHEYALVESGAMGWLKTGAVGPAQIVWKEAAEDREDPNYAWAIVILGGGAAATTGVFPVTVTIDGGSAGSASTTCSFTYEVKALDGSVIGTGKAPEKRRFTLTEYTTTPDASPGLAYYDSDGVLHLFDANELPGDTECPE